MEGQKYKAFVSREALERIIGTQGEHILQQRDMLRSLQAVNSREVAKARAGDAFVFFVKVLFRKIIKSK